MKYYILKISNAVSSFSEIIANQQITTKLNSNINVQIGDKCLGFVTAPSNQIRFIFECSENTNNKNYFFDKKLQCLDGSTITDINLINKITSSDDVLIEITAEEYNELKNQLINKICDTFAKTNNSSKTTKNNNINYKQIIYYGVPGSGKSFKINNDFERYGISKENTCRVVFHPEFTNSDFIGQIVPMITENGVDYKFKPGEFTKILRTAYENPNNHYALIIEEINRGNAAAIFGDLFQLLDRLEDGEEDTVGGNTYTRGWSSYGVQNDYINAYIRGVYDTPSTDKNDNIHEIIFTPNTGIRLPPNLSIFATMNTSDQNVFKLDNAFKRRWALQMIPNKFNLADDLQRAQCDAEIEGFNFTWGAFLKVINYEIIHNDESETNSFSDKQIGTWFVKNEKDSDDTPIIPLEIFKYKVLEYLWDDVFTEPTALYNTDYKSFSELLEDIDNNDRDQIFNQKIIEAIDLAQTEINKEKQEAVKQLKLMVAESNFTEEQQQLVNQDFNIPKETVSDVGRYIRDTLVKLSNENTIVYENFERRNQYITFTTKAMTEVLPEIEKPESSWNTTSVYYYWISFDPNVRGLQIDGHLELGGENIPIETRDKMKNIFKLLKPNSEKEISPYNRVAKTKWYDIDSQNLKESVENAVRKIVEDLLKIESNLLAKLNK